MKIKDSLFKMKKEMSEIAIQTDSEQGRLPSRKTVRMQDAEAGSDREMFNEANADLSLVAPR